MKRKRENESDELIPQQKRTKINFYIFIYAYDIETIKQPILAYDNSTKKLIRIDINFNNWFYLKPNNYDFSSQEEEELQEKILKLNGIKKIEIVKIAYDSNQTNGDVDIPYNLQNIGPLFQIFYEGNDSRKIINSTFLKDAGFIYESNIKRSDRFIYHNEINFLKKFTIDILGNFKIYQENSSCSFEIDFLLTSKAGGLKNQTFYKVNQEYDICQSDIKEISNNRDFIQCCWDEKDQLYQSDNLTQFVIYLKDFCFNFLRIKKDTHSEKLKVQMFDYYYISNTNLGDNNESEYRKRFFFIDKLFREQFQTLLYYTKIVPISIMIILKVPNRKITPDSLYLSNYNKDPQNNFKIVCMPPMDMNTYASNSYNEIFSQKRFFDVVDEDEEEKIIEIDNVSMYSKMMMEKFKDDPILYPLLKPIKIFVQEKESEKNPIKKIAKKTTVNSIYGCFGINEMKKMYLICGNPTVAMSIANNSRKLIELGINFFSKPGIKVISCCTDSITLIGKTKLIDKLLNEWNSMEKHINTKIDPNGETKFLMKKSIVAKKLLIINKNTKAWIDENDEIKLNGWNFNSILKPQIVRKFMKKFMFELLTKCKDVNQMVKKFDTIKNKILNWASNYRISNLIELVYVKNEKREKKKPRFFNKEKNKKIDLFVKGYSTYNNSLVEMNFYKAIDICSDVENRNFKIERSIEELINEFKKLFIK